jgi:hypothetical protein
LCVFCIMLFVKSPPLGGGAKKLGSLFLFFSYPPACVHYFTSSSLSNLCTSNRAISAMLSRLVLFLALVCSALALAPSGPLQPLTQPSRRDFGASWGAALVRWLSDSS